MERHFYIYNSRQADFFHKSGLPILEIGKGTHGDTYIKFLRNEASEKVFTEWIERKDKELIK